MILKEDDNVIEQTISEKLKFNWKFFKDAKQNISNLNHPPSFTFFFFMYRLHCGRLLSSLLIRH